MAKTASLFFSSLALIAANLIPLYAVWFQGVNVFFLMLLYWLESFIIGFFTFQKIRHARGERTHAIVSYPSGRTWVEKLSPTSKAQAALSTDEASLNAERAFFAPFFLLHYGIFMGVHLIFIFVLFFSWSISLPQLMIAFLSLCLSHGLSYQGNFIGNREFEHTSAGSVFFQPYPRIIVMHVSIIVSAFFILGKDGAQIGLTILVLIKIVVDLLFHLWEHKNKGTIVA
jgi:hypothetical protein